MKKIGFLFETNYKIGGGHFWRCFNFAKILKKRKRVFYFISKDLNKSFINILKKENFSYLNINSLKKISHIKDIVKKKKIEILISDYYHLDTKMKGEIKKKIKTLIVIDDFTHKKHNCDVYINNNFMSEKTKFKIKKLNPDTKLFLGTNYFIQPKKFFFKKKKINDKIKKVFVFFGSSDPSNETVKFINAVGNFKKIKFFILIGKINKNYEQIEKLTNNKKNMKIFHNLTNLETLELMKNKDFSFGAGGINLFERLFQGLPSAVICNAENQKSSLMELKKKNVIYFLGYKNKISKLSITNFFKNLISKPKIIYKLHKNTYKYFGVKNNSNLLKYELNKIINRNAI